MQQDKSMKENWLYACGGGVHGKTTSVKNCSYGGKYLNTIVSSAVAKAPKLRNI